MEANQKRTQEDLSAMDKMGTRKTNWDGPWADVKYTHDFDIAKIRVISKSTVVAIQCVSRDGREGLIYGGAQSIKELPEGAKWWTDEIVLARDEYIRKAAWKKPIDFSGPGWIWNLQISTNTRQLPLLGGKYTSDNEPCEVAGFDLPVKGIMVVNGKTVETS